MSHRVDYLDDPEAPRANSIVVATSVYVKDEQDRLLLISRTDNGLWALPGGAVEVGETVSEAAARETREETGFDVVTNGVIGIFTNPNHVVAYPDGEVRQQFSICLRGRVVGGEIATSDESREVGWFATDQLASLSIHPEIRRRLDQGALESPSPWVD